MVRKLIQRHELCSVTIPYVGGKVIPQATRLLVVFVSTSLAAAGLTYAQSQPLTFSLTVKNNTIASGGSLDTKVAVSNTGTSAVGLYPHFLLTVTGTTGSTQFSLVPQRSNQFVNVPAGKTAYIVGSSTAWNDSPEFAGSFAPGNYTLQYCEYFGQSPSWTSTCSNTVPITQQ